MFEKEAEEYSNNWKINKNNDLNFAELVELRAVIYKANKDGAELGFQKGIKARINTTTISDCPIKDEWHYVKDGDLPPLNINVLVIHKWHKTPEVGKRITVFINSSEWVWAMCCDRYRYTSDDKNVIAWKEIVLPELKEFE